MSTGELLLIRCNISDDLNLQQLSCENLKSGKTSQFVQHNYFALLLLQYGIHGDFHILTGRKAYANIGTERDIFKDGISLNLIENY